jgi:ribonucleoside-triphosphate reductase
LFWRLTLAFGFLKIMDPDQKCHDCQAPIELNGDDIKNGVLLAYKDEDGKEYEIFKCRNCYDASPRLADYRPCEVYSRVCGYLRPVGQWNTGKRQEYAERKEYKSEC